MKGIGRSNPGFFPQRPEARPSRLLDRSCPVSTRSPSPMPTFYIPHGGGHCFFMDWDPPVLRWGLVVLLRALPVQLQDRPRAVVDIRVRDSAQLSTAADAAS